ncbi:MULTISPECIES: Hsp20/alpha crystallin family protein [Nonomuraea]|uniref:Hsp20/alpha crystallin family protein n=1 Tax=Nonomuraea ferruginea TaxID=46174 RepID=A0ABT4T7T8_9ACTN|nr:MULTISPECIES: Hsp20/alpha crystallin family protein [Nonomuraea]MDA0645583.1 Hsp20/alpha crystallin family protein [Nonomuraea ferruginea]TXK41000.1 Hsp20/alpha crystallin family protein [Nonomuraea sp. C10]
MNLPERRDVRFPFPELLEWVENPMFGFRPFGQLVRVEDYIADDRYVLRAELPGVDPEEDIEVTVDGGMLHIRAEKTHRATEPHRSEFAYGALSRTVTLPATARTDDVKAVYKDGVLEISVGLEEEKKAEGRRIAVEH